ncbi:MAG: ATP-dependent dethiobiotin synthetase BioD [Bacteroides sp.]|nr:ATP-dependent dethiobiotin synthetase BioD [Bacteroides sp.]
METAYPSRIFVTGIGTDVGKSYATGWLARRIADSGRRTITQKFIQTGNTDMSEDILVHRRIMGIPLQAADRIHLTCPIILSYPASPHLAARIDDTVIDPDVAARATEALLSEYSTVLIEGAGGIMVPITESMLTIDYIESHGLPTVVVTNGQLGSISNTLLTLEAIARRDIPLWGVIYNPHFDSDKVIADDAREYMHAYVRRHFPSAHWLTMDE